LTIAIPPLLLQAAIPKVLYRNEIPFLNNSTGCHKNTRKIWSISVFRSSKNGSKQKPIQPMVRTEFRTLRRRRNFKITRRKNKQKAESQTKERKPKREFQTTWNCEETGE
jgi:hypothetical protein